MTKEELQASASPATTGIAVGNGSAPAAAKKKKIRRMTRTEVMEVSVLLTEHLAHLGEKHFRYSSDMDDRKIAALVSPDLNAGHVARLRLELFGELAAKDNEDSFLVAQKIADLTERVEELEVEMERKDVQIVHLMQQAQNLENRLAEVHPVV